MLDVYEITSLEQLRAISDLLRVRILDNLKEKPLTVTQLAELLGMAPAKVHYHVRELEKVQLLKLVETREKGGILEKYYQAVARNINVSKGLFSSLHQDEAVEGIRQLLNQARDGYLTAFELELQDTQAPGAGLAFFLSRLYVTRDEMQELLKRIAQLYEAYEKPRRIEGEQEVMQILFSYPEHQKELAMPAALITDTQPEQPEQEASVGVRHINRHELEQALQQNKHLHLSIVGLCIIASDVPFELVQATIEKFSLVGRLQAAPDIYDYLMSMRHQP
ncbi:helix-turn-helix domain-containing protein [Ktedonobacter robiniae]|uniref:HTH arsR-type domain-containing protein n=1 Tax=Ktedonobacter robiniae TaxID=2778365 RepID=A0ABQ3UJD2_9CHLR|nr:helix-turn-helix domain-containing protein [Ktedonobacter robiniae]GHO52788.1 hypothetical protein KSB_12630 [Ktedonobacter robiniae]